MKTKEEMLQLEIELADAERYLNKAGFANDKMKRAAEKAVSDICAKIDSADVIKSEISPNAWKELYGPGDFEETMDRGGVDVKLMMRDDPEDPLWEAVGICIASNFGDAWGGTNAPDSKVKTEFDIAPYVEYNECANIIVIDRLSSEDRANDNEAMLVINTLTGEAFEY